MLERVGWHAEVAEAPLGRVVGQGKPFGLGQLSQQPALGALSLGTCMQPRRGQRLDLSWAGTELRGAGAQR